MRNIKEVEELTGISRQNIRYYEKQGLLTPHRNRTNAYREYSDQDIWRLKQIKFFRKLNMPIEEIRKLMNGDITLLEAVERQKEQLADERSQLEAALKFCGKIKESSLEEMNVDFYLEEMQQEEQAGSVFATFLEDYKKVIQSELVREFSFMPDTRCATSREFTEALCKHAEEEKLNLVIIRESMSPRFTIDGIEYKAYRTSSRFGIIVHCEMVHPEDYIPEGMPKKKYYKYRTISLMILPVLVFAICNLDVFLGIGYEEPLTVIVAILMVVVIGVPNLFYLTYCYGKNFRG